MIRVQLSSSLHIRWHCPSLGLEWKLTFSSPTASAEFSKFADILSAVAQLVENLFAMQETQVQFLGWEDALEKEMATHSCILAWGIPWTGESGGLQSMGLQRAGHD